MIFPQKSTDDDAEVITIIGRKEKAEAARDHLKGLIKDLVSVNTTPPSGHHPPTCKTPIFGLWCKNAPPRGPHTTILSSWGRLILVALNSPTLILPSKDQICVISHVCGRLSSLVARVVVINSSPSRPALSIL